MNAPGFRISRTLQPLKAVLGAHPSLIAFILVSAALYLTNLPRSGTPYWYDAGQYWDFRSLFDGGAAGRFSLLNYNASIRTYLLPLLFYAISKLASVIAVSPSLILEIVQALAFGGMLTVIVPRLAAILLARRAGFWEILAFSAPVVFFWQGYFYYPLSDFWAILFLLLCLYLLISPAAGWPGFLVAGALGGGAFLLRSVYGAAVVGLILWFADYCRRQRLMSWKQVGLSLLLAAVGLLGILVPQMMINAEHFGTWSPMPQTQRTYSQGLFAQQLGGGIQFQRYETFVGDPAEYPTPGVFFLDPQGIAILARSGYPPVTDPYNYPLTVLQYARLAFRHPLDFVVIYARHLFNGLDVVYDTPYIYDLYNARLLTRWINYSLWFLVAVYVRRALAARDVPGHWLLLLLILALPSLASIPAAMESRFMLPVDFFAYGIVAFMVLPAARCRPRADVVRLFWEYVPWYLFFVVMCFILSFNTFASMQSGDHLLW